MKYEYSTISTDRLKQLLQQSGMSDRVFSKKLWGENTHQTPAYFEIRPDVRVSTLVKMAEILDCSIEDFLIKSDTTSDTPTVSGHHNVVNSSFVNTDVTTLKAEIKALKMVIEEKDLRIEDLKKANEDLGKRIDLVLQISQHRDLK